MLIRWFSNGLFPSSVQRYYVSGGSTRCCWAANLGVRRAPSPFHYKCNSWFVQGGLNCCLQWIAACWFLMWSLYILLVRELPLLTNLSFLQVVFFCHSSFVNSPTSIGPIPAGSFWRYVGHFVIWASWVIHSCASVFGLLLRSYDCFSFFCSIS